MPIANEIIVGPGFIPTITAGIAAASDFDTVRVLPGTYSENIVVDKTIQLLGAQAGVDARTRTGAPESIIEGTGARPFQVTADNVVIDGFTVQGNTLGHGISVGNVSGYWIFNNIIQNNTLGLFLDPNSGTTISQIRQNLFKDNIDPVTNGGTGIFTHATNLFIDSNRFTGQREFASINLTTGSTNVIVSNNYIVNDTSIALVDSTNIKITNNSLIDTQGTAIFISGNTNITEIERNIISGSTGNGISVNNIFSALPNKNIRAKDNSIEGNQLAGLNVNAGSYDDTTPNRPLDATNNWWGSPTGPTNPSNPAGTGDTVVDPDDVSIFIPFLRDNPLQEPPGTCVINPLVREASAPTRTFVAATKAAAVTAARTNAGTLAQAIGNLQGVWPEIRDYDAPNNASLFGEPAIVWEDFTAAPGELRYFSQAFQDVSNFPTSHVVFATVFTDNAHRLFIEEYDAAGTLVQSITPAGGLNDGIMLAAAGTTTDTTPPLNWQKIRQYSKVFTPTQSGNFIVITVEALNYNSLGPNNPAGVSFVADFYKTTP
jgi:hypothetical protein